MTSRTRPHWIGEVLIVLGLAVAYDQLFGLVAARVDEAVRRGGQVLRLEGWLHVDVERTLDHLTARSHAATVVLSGYYDLAHVTATLSVLVALYVWAPQAYRRARNGLVLVNLLAFAVFVAMPTAPPRLVPGAGFVDVVARSRTWGAWEQSSALAAHTNQYASLPSLHVGWALLSLLAVRSATSRRLPRALAGLHLALTAVVIVATGNHYVVDIAAGALLTAVCWRLARPAEAAAEAPEVLVLSASMGAGHDGVAYELAHRLRADGVTAQVHDYLTLMPFGIGSIIKRVYGEQLKHAPGTYEWLYARLDEPHALNRAALLIASTASRRIRRLAQGSGVVVATYPLAGRALGRMRRKGRLDVPAVTFLTDPEVHELWLDPGTDLYLAAYADSAAEASARTGRPAWGCGPVLPDRLAAPVSAAERAAARAALDLEGRRVALLVTGSWGVGDAAATARAVAAAGLTPVLLCGRNEQLLAELADDPLVRAVGWVDDVRPLYAAADVVVHNAGGLASVEAFAAGVPVVGHACLPGHGHRNAREMALQGIAEYADDDAALVDALHRLAGTPSGAALAARARGLFQEDPTARLTALARATQPVAAPVRAVADWGRRAAAVGAAVSVVLVGSSLGVSEATERGFGSTAALPAGDTKAVYLAVLLDARSLTDPATPRQLAATRPGVLVPSPFAEVHADALGRFAAAGIPLLPAAPDRLPRSPERATEAFHDASLDLPRAGGRPAPVVCIHGLGLIRLSEALAARVPFAFARYRFTPGQIPTMRGRSLAVLDATGLAPGDLPAALEAVREKVAAAGLHLAPLPASWSAT